MPVTKSATRALRKDKRRTAINKRIRRRYKTFLKKARNNPTLKNISLAFSALDRAAKKKVIHRNKASRLKARLAKLQLEVKKTKK